MAQTITIPTNISCNSRIYGLTLSPSPEVSGDHYSVIHFPPYVRGVWRQTGEDEWNGINETQGFYFTSAGESYQLRLWTGVTEPTHSIRIPYTVTASYAPGWAAITDIIEAFPIDDPCCEPVDPTPISIGIGTSFGASAAFETTYVVAEGHPQAGEIFPNWSVATPPPAEPGTFAMRATWTSIYGTGGTKVDVTTPGAIIETDTSAAVNKPNEWANTQFDYTYTGSVNKSLNSVFSGNCDPEVDPLVQNISGTATGSVTIRVWKASGSLIVRSQLLSSTAQITTDEVCATNWIFNNSATCEECPEGTQEDVYLDIPCSNAKIRMRTIGTYFGAMGPCGVNCRTYGCALSVTAQIVYPVP